MDELKLIGEWKLYREENIMYHIFSIQSELEGRAVETIQSKKNNNEKRD